MPTAGMNLPHMPPLSRARVVAPYVRTALNTAKALGVDLQASSAALQWPALADELRDNADVPVPRYIASLAHWAEQTQQPRFGALVGQRMQLSTFANYGLVLCACPDVREALRQTQRFECLAHDLGRSEWHVAGDEAVYRWHCPWLHLPGAGQLVESVLLGVHSFGHWLVGQALPLRSLRLPHAPLSPDAPAQDRAWLGLTVDYGAPVAEARFPAAVLDMPLSNADVSLFPALQQAAELRLHQREVDAAAPDEVSLLREHLAEHLMHGRVTLARMAQDLALSPRSLQRRLAAHGWSFSALLDEVRQERAQHYLRQPSLALAEVAFLLGFSDQSNFHHAFRQWFGCTPTAWREAHPPNTR